MVRLISGRPVLPAPPRGLPIEVTTWASNLVKVLTGVLSETNTAVNQIISQEGRPAFAAYLASDQTGVPLSTWTTVDIDTEEFDTDGAFNTTTSRFTPLSPGKYLFFGKIIFDAIADTSQTVIRVLKNGSVMKQGNRLRSGSAGEQGLIVSTIMEADGVDDFFELQVFQDDSASETILGGIQHTYFQAFRIGP